MAKKNINLNMDFTVENGDSQYDGMIEIVDGETQLCQVLDDDEDCSGERQFLADAVEVYYRKHPTSEVENFVYNHTTKTVTPSKRG